MAAARDVDEQLQALTTNAVHVETEADLRSKLERGRPLRVKLGIDPTASDIHLGFAVVLRKLRQFQELGHTAVLILGDFTAQVGDPSGRSATRPRLSKDEVDANAATYVEQIRKILLPEPLEVRRNSEWLATMGIEDVLRLTARTTVARMLERDDFAHRYRDGKPISLMELLYPLLQGWDSVMVNADVELGGTDQLFNNLMGRTLQEQEGREGQVVLTMPLLVGLDGTQKMSKSLGNFIGIEEPPAEQFGKVMSWPDQVLTSTLYSITTNKPEADLRDFSQLIETGESLKAKRKLGRDIVDTYTSGGGEAAEAEFDRVFKEHQPPSDVETCHLSEAEVGATVTPARLAQLCGLAKSHREGRRLVEQGGLRINDKKATDPDAELPLASLDGALVQKGRREWAKVQIDP